MLHFLLLCVAAWVAYQVAVTVLVPLVTGAIYLILHLAFWVALAGATLWIGWLAICLGIHRYDRRRIERRGSPAGSMVAVDPYAWVSDNTAWRLFLDDYDRWVAQRWRSEALKGE